MVKKKRGVRSLWRNIRILEAENEGLRSLLDKMVGESELALIHEAYADQMRALEEEIKRLRG